MTNCGIYHHGGICGAKTDGFICRACLEDLERTIGDFQSLLHEVSLVATRQTRVYRANGGRPDDEPDDIAAWDKEQAVKDARLPKMLRSREGRVALPETQSMVNLAARDLLYDAYDTLLSWACRLGADEISSKHVAAWLLSNVNEIRWHEDAAELFDEFTYLHDRMVRAVDRSPSRIYAGPCTAEDCTYIDREGVSRARDTYAAFRPSTGSEEDDRNDRVFKCDGYGQDEVGCGTPYTWGERRPWLAQTVRGQLVAIEDLLDALPDLFPDLAVPKRHAAQQWARDGKIVERLRDRLGRPLYSGQELLDRIAKYTPHRYAPRRRAS